ARREDGLSRLVLWRDVVGVVARRMPPAYDGAAFVDIVSTAGSTLRIVPWTRLSGQLIDIDDRNRTRAVVEHVVAPGPSGRRDPAVPRHRRPRAAAGPRHAARPRRAPRVARARSAGRLHAGEQGRAPAVAVPARIIVERVEARLGIGHRGLALEVDVAERRHA